MCFFYKGRSDGISNHYFSKHGQVLEEDAFDADCFCRKLYALIEPVFE
jgi:hypothetical protein